MVWVVRLRGDRLPDRGSGCHESFRAGMPKAGDASLAVFQASEPLPCCASRERQFHLRLSDARQHRADLVAGGELQYFAAGGDTPPRRAHPRLRGESV